MNGEKYMNKSKDGVIINNISYNLDELEKDCWIRLVNSAIKSRDSFHTPCIATLNNGEVSMRTVVLRKSLPLLRVLRFHTDVRSEKWKELKINNSISALFYDPSSRIQLRVKGKALFHFNDEISSEAWKNTNLSSRRCYLTNSSPSSFTEFPTSGLSKQIEQENFILEESEIGERHFGIVSINVETIEWLWLNHAGHRRAHFDYKLNRYRWMIP